MSEPKLLPCPFCGDEAQVREVDGYSPMFFVECINCDANVGAQTGTVRGLAIAAFHSEDDAVAAWNRRAKPEHGEG